MTTDINPDFLFDFGSSEAPVQAAWEFGGVLRRFAAAVEYGHGGRHAATAVILPNEVSLSRMNPLWPFLSCALVLSMMTGYICRSP